MTQGVVNIISDSGVMNIISDSGENGDNRMAMNSCVRHRCCFGERLTRNTHVGDVVLAEAMLFLRKGRCCSCVRDDVVLATTM